MRGEVVAAKGAAVWGLVLDTHGSEGGGGSPNLHGVATLAQIPTLRLEAVEVATPAEE